MMRVVADTNVLISALMFGGLPGTFLDLALAKAFTLVSSEALLDELYEKLRGKFAVPELRPVPEFTCPFEMGEVCHFIEENGTLGQGLRATAILEPV